MANPRVFKVEITNTATYYVKEEETDGILTEDEAIAIAFDWFLDREPEVYCEELEASSYPAIEKYCG